MNAAQLLSEMQARRINVTLLDGRLQFRAPKGALTDELKRALGVHREAVVAALASETETSQSIPPAPAACAYRASFAQERLWFLDQYELGASSYAMPTAVRLKGHFDIAVFQTCVDALVARHASLRTVFADVGGEAHQRVLEAVRVPCRIVDLGAISPTRRETMAFELVEEEIQAAFELATGPLLRVLVIGMSGRDQPEHVVVFTMHHIVSDGWSSEVLLREFANLYEARRAGRDAELPLLPIQYVDYAVWQREWLSGGALDRQLAYWRSALAGANFTLELPTDRPRPLVQDSAGQTIRFEIPADLTGKLRELARKEGATLYMILLAAFFILLSRWTGERDICVGTPVANRRRVELEGLIGFFVNSLVMRGDLTGDPDFVSLLGRVRSFGLAAQEHQDAPFERLVEALPSQRGLSRCPLFQTMFSLQNAPLQRFALPGLVIEPFEAEGHTSKFDLSFELLEEADGRLLGEAEYATALFDRATIERMTGHYLTLLGAIVATPRARVDQLNMLPPQERELLLHGFNEAHATFRRDHLLHELFAAQVEKTPHAVALVHDGQQLSYEELNLRANGLAHWLIRQGVGPDVVVSLCLERSLEMVVAILATLKAGGAYLPLDPTLPDQRLATMIDDAAPKVVLTEEKLRARLAAIIGNDAAMPPDALFALDAPALALEATHNPKTKTAPENLAYLIYTSGSTGKPKAVAVSHSNVTRLFAATQGVFNFTAADVWTLFHSYAFDFSVWEIWGALLYGGRLVIVPFLVSRSPEEFHGFLAVNGVTVLNQTPSAFHRLDEADRLVETPLNLRLVIFGGEALDQRRLVSWFERHPYCRPRLVNMYGITETTVHVTLKEIAGDDANGANVGTIGTPLPDLACYILDRSLLPAPIGVRGELYVGGAGLARGYINRPDLTAERFVPNPFSGSGERLYRTGDLARYRPDGEIEYLGRADHQVKIRGFRIELGEIEAVLAKLPGVRGAAAFAKDDGHGDQRLVAYVAADNPDAFDVEAARAALRGTLPDYMVPAAIGALERLPLNQNGKIDRKALPELDSRTGSKAHVAPRTPSEWIVLQAFKETLGIDNVGMNDNFFELGGNSILGLKLVERIRCSLSEEMFVAAIFRAPTPAELASLIGAESQTRASPLVRLSATASHAPLYCVHPAGGSTVRYRPLADRLASICSVYGLQSRSLLDPDHHVNSIRDMAQDYVAVLRQHRPRGPYRLVGWSAGAVIALAIAAEIERAGESVDFVGLLDPAIGVQVGGAASSMSDYLESFAEFQGVPLELTEHDKGELTELADGLDDRARFIAAGLWGRDRGLWSDVSAEVLALLYDDSRAFEAMLAEHSIEPIDADLHIWWARDADATPARRWTRGRLHSTMLDTSHERIVVDALAHDSMAATLAALQQAKMSEMQDLRNCERGPS